MTRKNLKHQMLHSIDNAFCPGVKKRDLTPGEREQKTMIMSHQYKHNIRDTACDFARYAKEEFGIKMARDLRPEHAQAFLDSKAKHCSPTTLDQYRSRLSTLGDILSDNYGYAINLTTQRSAEPPEAQKMRSIAMDRSHYDKLMEHGNECQSKMAIQVAEAFGLRVSELSKLTLGDIKEDVLHIHQSKGGRDRDIEIRTDHQREVLEAVQAYSKAEAYNDRLFTVQPDSINKYLHTTLTRLGINEYDEHNTGIHSVRKMYATERYDELREAGVSHKEAWGDVSEELGHGRDREDLFRVYVVHK